MGRGASEGAEGNRVGRIDSAAHRIGAQVSAQAGPVGRIRPDRRVGGGVGELQGEKRLHFSLAIRGGAAGQVPVGLVMDHAGGEQAQYRHETHRDEHGRDHGLDQADSTLARAALRN